MKKIFTSILIFSLTASLMLMPFFSLAKAQNSALISAVSLVSDYRSVNFTYGGSLSGSINDQPQLSLSARNGDVLYHSGNLSIGVTAHIDRPDAQNFGVALYQVSYTASWQNNAVESIHLSDDQVNS